MQVLTTTMSGHNECQNIRERKKILSDKEYVAVCEFVQNFHGLAIDCEIAMTQQHFADIDAHALKCIQQAELANFQRSNYGRFEQKAREYLLRFEQQAAKSCDTTLLLQLARDERVSPVNLCRILLKAKYPEMNKIELTRLLKYPQLIEEPKLASNVKQCLCSDTQDGPLVDLRRRFLGEEYEMKLKELARAAGMHFYDEHALRLLGYDKTPDIKMILPFLHKGEVVNWIESKAVFGDIATHRSYIELQLNSYCNRFGSGIIIYWFGYHEQVPQMSENSVGITVLADFPAAADIVLMDVAAKSPVEQSKATEQQNNQQKTDEQTKKPLTALREDNKADFNAVGEEVTHIAEHFADVNLSEAVNVKKKLED